MNKNITILSCIFTYLRIELISNKTYLVRLSQVPSVSILPPAKRSICHLALKVWWQTFNGCSPQLIRCRLRFPFDLILGCTGCRHSILCHWHITYSSNMTEHSLPIVIRDYWVWISLFNCILTESKILSCNMDTVKLNWTSTCECTVYPIEPLFMVTNLGYNGVHMCCLSCRHLENRDAWPRSPTSSILV